MTRKVIVVLETNISLHYQNVAILLRVSLLQVSHRRAGVKRKMLHFLNHTNFCNEIDSKEYGHILKVGLPKI